MNEGNQNNTASGDALQDSFVTLKFKVDKESLKKYETVLKSVTKHLQQLGDVFSSAEGNLASFNQSLITTRITNYNTALKKLQKNLKSIAVTNQETKQKARTKRSLSGTTFADAYGNIKPTLKDNPYYARYLQIKDEDATAKMVRFERKQQQQIISERKRNEEETLKQQIKFARANSNEELKRAHQFVKEKAKAANLKVKAIRSQYKYEQRQEDISFKQNLILQKRNKAYGRLAVDVVKGIISGFLLPFKLPRGAFKLITGFLKGFANFVVPTLKLITLPFKILSTILKGIFSFIGKVLSLPIKLAKAFLLLGFAGGVYTTYKLANLAKVLADLDTKLVNLSQRTGISVQTFRNMGFAAEMMGADAKTMQQTLEQLRTKGLTIDLVRQRLAQFNDERQRLLAAQNLGIDTSLIPVIMDPQFTANQNWFNMLQAKSGMSSDVMALQFRQLQQRLIKIREIINMLGRSIITRVLPIVQPLLDRFINFLLNKFDLIVSKAQTLVNWFIKFASNPTVRGIFTWILNKTIAIAQAIKKWFTNEKGAFWDGSSAQEFFQKLHTWAIKVRDTIIDLWNKHLKPLWTSDTGKFEDSPLGQFLLAMKEAVWGIVDYIRRLLVAWGLLDDVDSHRLIKYSDLSQEERNKYLPSGNALNDIERNILGVTKTQRSFVTDEQGNIIPQRHAIASRKGTVIVDLSDANNVKMWNALGGFSAEEARAKGFEIFTGKSRRMNYNERGERQSLLNNFLDPFGSENNQGVFFDNEEIQKRLFKIPQNILNEESIPQTNSQTSNYVPPVLKEMLAQNNGINSSNIIDNRNYSFIIHTNQAAKQITDAINTYGASWQVIG